MAYLAHTLFGFLVLIYTFAFVLWLDDFDSKNIISPFIFTSSLLILCNFLYVKAWNIEITLKEKIYYWVAGIICLPPVMFPIVWILFIVLSVLDIEVNTLITLIAAILLIVLALLLFVKSYIEDSDAMRLRAALYSVLLISVATFFSCITVLPDMMYIFISSI